MADHLSIDANQHQQQLYYSIRLNNSDNTLHAWMRHILSYLTSSERHNNHHHHHHQNHHNNELLARNELQMQEPHVPQGAVCDGSSDCQSNLWAHEVSYEQHYRKLLMSRVNVGDTNHVNSVDQESLRREASLVMESVDPAARPQQQAGLNRDQNANIISGAGASTPMDVESISERSRYSDWDFVMYDSDVESTDESDNTSSDPTYEISESDLIKLDDDYTSGSDEEDYDYDCSDHLSDTSDDTSDSLRLDDGYSSENSERTLKYRRVTRNVSATSVNTDAATNTNTWNSSSSAFEYYYCTSDDDFVRSESEWDMSSSN